MIAGTTEKYAQAMQYYARAILAKVLVDWDNDGEYTNESLYIESITVERTLEEPLGGFASAICDVNLVNDNNRYTPTP